MMNAVGESLACGVLRVVFERRGDRFAHRIEHERDGEFQPLFESLEGSEQFAWPTSPPLQSLHFEERPDGRRVALLVGMAGRSHWSAAVEADPSTGRITFDVACRVQEEPAWLGSSYRVVDEGARTEVTPLMVDRSHSASPKRQDDQLILTAPRGSDPLPCTVRWRYVISRDGVLARC